MGRRHLVIRDESRSRHANVRAIRTKKGRRDRRIPIHATFCNVLDAKCVKGATGRVFAAAKGGELHDGNMRKILVEQVLTPLAKDFPAPPDGPGFINGRLHSFRHYFCSWCANSSVSLQAAMDWLGHRDSRMVRHYYHLHDREAQQQMQKLGSIPGLNAT
ncbi:MAG: hypothetical protein C0485_10755 [Pirellula sp.]|nr:hypothetical protein [Pirellula sp.]